MCKALATGDENEMNNADNKTPIKTTVVWLRLKILFASAPGFVANRKKAVSIPNIYTMLITPTKAYSLVIWPYSAVLNMLIVWSGTSRKLRARGKMLPMP